MGQHHPQSDRTAGAPHVALSAVQDGRRFWRSLEELAGDEQFFVSLAREFPEHANRLTDGATRRQFLQLMGASLALAGLQGCVEQPQEVIVPHVLAPEHLVPGKPLYYATATTLDGAGAGLLVESHMGRPIKIEGNPLHPAVPHLMAATNQAAGGGTLRFGATSVFSQAAVLSLYDPDRSQTVLRNGQIATWEDFAAELQAQLAKPESAGGRSLRILTETVVSPTLADQLQRLLETFPQAQWHQFEPIHRDNELLGSRLAFGVDVQPLYDVAAADVILALDADFLAEGPMHLQHARGFARRRRPDRPAAPQEGAEDAALMNRLYVVESSITVTGAAADHRLPLAPPAVAAFTARLAAALGLELNVPAPLADAEAPQPWLDAVVADLQRARGRSLVLAGRGQPPLVHALAHWINQALGNIGQTVEYREPIAARAEPQVDSLQNLVDALRDGQVQTLIILGGNPAFNAPADVSFTDQLKLVPFTVHLSQYEDETSQLCRWHIPELHFLEAWSDTRAADGTASIVQPLIAPLHGGKSPHEVLAAILSTVRSLPAADEATSAPETPPARARFATTCFEIVRAYWQRRHAEAHVDGDFETFWNTALHDGIVAGTQAPSVQPSISADFGSAINEALASLPQPSPTAAMQVVFQLDPCLWDDRFANNGWLQELPRPLTSLTWDNAALIAPATAQEHRLHTGDVVEIAVAQRTIEIPVLIVPGQTPNVVALQLGYGRQRAGRIGSGVGTDVYPLRTSGAMWHAVAATLRPTGQTRALALTQTHHAMEGRNVVRAGTLDEFLEHPEHPPFMAAGHHNPEAEASIYPEYQYDGYKWGMVINQSACIGCNACVVACQAENNIPVVGREQVLMSREMHWLRIDHYYEGEPENPDHYHQPMLCQHCEKAPCEPVCPVAATTHSSEGLNEMVYNRCVGTRYCSNNCPYKVRRFNFLDYNAPLRNDPTLQLLPNPDVTVRSRGVMEKCTYCVQRISAARIAAEKEGRAIRDGEVITACQAACPTEAIVFGDLNDPNSRLRQEAASPLNYAVLGDLNTQPRTTYLAAVRNPNPALIP
jgi:molybdopterin-containing oxidoreductase family iron-sulfur binding subunit